MNVLILFSQPWRVGGAETHVEAMLTGFSSDKVYLAINEGSDQSRVQYLQKKYPNLTIIVIQARGIDIFRWRKDFIMLKQLIIREQITIVSAQQRTAGLWAHFLWRNTKVPFTVTMHDLWHRAKFKTVYAKLFTDIFVVNTNLAERLRADFGFRDAQIHLIDNGIDFTEFKPAQKAEARKKLGLNTLDKIILHVSRLSRIKGSVSLVIIDSMVRVLDEEPKAKLMIIGEGPMRCDIEKRILIFNQSCEGKIQIHDFVDDIITWYNAADILIGEGRVAIEALACLKPVVAIRNTERFIGVVDTENIEYACDVNFDGKDQCVSPEAIAEEVMKACRLSIAESEEIANKIKSRLSSDLMAERYMEVFNSIICHD